MKANPIPTVGPVAKSDKVCVTPGCRGPKQPGRDHCNVCISNKCEPNRRADMVDHVSTSCHLGRLVSS